MLMILWMHSLIFYTVIGAFVKTSEHGPAVAGVRYVQLLLGILRR